MDINVKYKEVDLVLYDLESQLDENERLISNSKPFSETENEIESHFEKCVNALNRRKQVLLTEANKKYQEQEKQIQETQNRLKEAIEDCREMLLPHSALRSSNDPPSWKPTSNIDCTQFEIQQLTISLPRTLCDSIDEFGAVIMDIPNQQHKRSYSGGPRSFARAEMVTTFAGPFEKLHSSPNPATSEVSQALNCPNGIYFNPYDDCIYLCDTSSRVIRKIDMNGKMSLFANKKQCFMKPLQAITMYHKDRSFFVSAGPFIYKVTRDGEVSVFSGTGKVGHKDGDRTRASFHSPYGIAIDQQTGNLYVSDHGNHLIRRITQAGDVTTIAGSLESGLAEGNGAKAKFMYPWGIVFDEVERVLFVCDYRNSKLRQVTLEGEVTTVSALRNPSFAVITPSRTLIISSFASNRIYQVLRKDGKYISGVIAGRGESGGEDGVPSFSSFNSPSGIGIDEKTHSCFVVDCGSSKIRKISFVN